MNHETARARFETFAAMGDGELPPDPIDALQVRLHRWQIAKFGLQPMERMVLGVVEEMGELAEAIRKGDFSEQADAIGDIAVYAAQLLTLNRMAIGTVFDTTSEWPGAFSVGDDPCAEAAGELSHVTLKRLQGIRGFDDDAIWQARLFGAVFGVLWSVAWCTGHDKSIAYCFMSVAEHVMARTGDMLPKVVS